MKTRLHIALLSLLCLVALTAHAEVIPFDVEVGYRWLDLSGNEDMYRTQINERSGLLVRSFTMTEGGKGSSLYDRFHIDASDVGVGPAGNLRIQAEKVGIYRLNLKYRRSDAFSALPEFANPLLGQGIIPGQHTYDRRRNMFDADLEFLQSERFTPFLGLSANRYSGPGTTTYHVGQDEFMLDSNLRDTDREYRVGTGFNFGTVYGQVTQGWRKSHTTERMTLAPGGGTGNNPGPVLGQNQTATQISRTDKTDASTPFFNGFVTAQVKSLRLIGNYVRFSADSDGSETESVTGTLASFALSRFFTGLNETATSSAKNHSWRGGIRGEVTLLDKVDVFAGYQRDHRELDGSALINTLFLQTLTFGGIDPRDLPVILNASTALDRTEDYTNVGVSAKVIGPLAVRGEYRVTNLDVNVQPDLSEIVVPGPQGGAFSRQVETLDLDATAAKSGFLLGAAYRDERGDAPIFRTDFSHRDRIRLRGGWTGFADRIKVGAVVENMHQDNTQTAIWFDNKVRQYSGDVAYTPVKQLTLHASLSRFKSDSTIFIRRPQTFATDVSIHAENGKAKEGGFTFVFAPVTLDTNFSRFDNSGTNPFKIDRARVRVSVDLPARTGVIAEYDQDRYREALNFGDFNAKRYGIYLHYRP